MEENEQIVEHHDDEEMEKMETGRGVAGSVCDGDEGSGSTQSSHRLLAYSDALISIIATVMVRHHRVSLFTSVFTKTNNNT